MSFYAANGSINVSVVSGTSYTGGYAADGSMNVILAPGSSYVGAYHPCGAHYVTLSPGTLVPIRAPDGSLYVTTTGGMPPINSGQPVTVVSGSFGFTPTYFVNSVSGLDTNNGRSTATAWQTLAKVNASTFLPGDVIGFSGTFTDTLLFPSSGSAGNPIVLTSYGVGGRAIFASTGSLHPIKITDQSYITIDNINFSGSGGSTTTGAIYLESNLVSGVTNLTVQNVAINGFTAAATDGIDIAQKSTSTFGLTNITVKNFTVTNCNGNGVSSFRGGASLGAAVHTNVNISNGTVNNCGLNGVVLGNINGGSISNVVAFSNGGLSTAGPVGIWTYESTGLTIKFCESYNNTALSGPDGGGFDLDGGCSNCIIEYCYSHGNRSAGFLFFNYGGVTWSNNTVRYCISENDSVINTLYSPITINTGGTSLTNLMCYNNTIYSNISTPVVLLQDTGATGHFANNILYCPSSLITSTANSAIAFTGNDYWTTGTFTINWNSVVYNTFAAWQTATGQEKIASVNVGLNVDPKLNSPGTGGTVGGYVTTQPSAYMLQGGSPMLGAGIDLSAQFSISPGSQDFYGNVISNPFAVGAFQ